ncbi:MAG: cysteine--tRNA ligase [Hyphomicrobiaceae bacterium]|nr:cysteine--tRNA ligase [Hyphomicrobiaceae bacterium]
MTVTLTLYNTLTRRKEPFRPLDPANVRMYVCGPTVYDYAHIGNARPVIVFDVLFRLLRHVYGPEHVTYARNITDVDDKINARAAEEGVSIREITERTTRQFHEDIAALGVLPPTVEPRATDHIEDMKRLIEALVAKGCAYVAQDHVLFDVAAMPDYGRLANRSLEEMEAGARVEVAPYKKGPMDFVLWKPSKPGEPAWQSPCGIAAPGRPGWHIECSAMAERHLGQVFDIHGGGIDLVFPHHENEVAQSRCAHGTPLMAQVWMHNGFLQVEGEKMSKSLGNFVTIRELLNRPIPALTPIANQDGPTPVPPDWKVKWNGLSVRFAMLLTRYREPINWTERRFFEASDELYRFYEVLRNGHYDASLPDRELPEPMLRALCDDLNTSAAITQLRAAAKMQDFPALGAGLSLLGLLDPEFVERDDLLMFDRARALSSDDQAEIKRMVQSRSDARKAKNFAKADRIRDELAAMGIRLKDSKDPATGEIVTTWEAKR